jgi:NDP-sugar pyrophosphorylase family protein
MIPALVLTAGLATRLRPLSLVRAKAAMPVAGDVLVRRILRQLQTTGVRDVVLNLHHLPHTITRELGDGSDLGLRVRYSWEVPVLGSAGGPRQALPLLGEPTFLIVNGDTLTDVDIVALIDEHRRTRARVTMAVVPNVETDKYGSVLVDDSGIVTGFAGRGTLAPRTLGRTIAPSNHRTIAPFHFVGVQVAEADTFASVPPGAVAESFSGIYRDLIRNRSSAVCAYATDAAFLDIGTPEDYLRTTLQLAARDGGALLGTGTHVDASARVEGSVLWDDVIVEAGASLRGCVVTDGARVPAGTSWTGMMLRRVAGQLVPGEERVGDLAVAPIRNSQLSTSTSQPTLNSQHPTPNSQGPTSSNQNT